MWARGLGTAEVPSGSRAEHIKIGGDCRIKKNHYVYNHLIEVTETL
jgi:hypothetical protein